MSELITTYLSEVEAEYKRGNATEHSYRPALKGLIESFGKTIHAVNEPRRVEFGVERDLRARSGEADAVCPADAQRASLQQITSFPVAGDNEVAKVYPKFVNVDEASSLVQQNKSASLEQTRQDASSTLGQVRINKTQYFDGVPSRVWNFTIGGCQVCEKWLKDRRGRTLSLGDVRHYQKIVVALRRTDDLMAEIDAMIPGWPMQ